eukprot:6466096-Amphidinium_carterae.1
MIQDKPLQDYLYLQPVTTYVAARQAVMDYLALKVRPDDGGVAPMDLSSLVPPGKGKGKDGKNKGKGKGKYNSKGDKDGGKGGAKDGPKSGEKCWNCGKPGHKWADCWQPGGGAAKDGKTNQAAQKGKGKGKGKKGLNTLEGDQGAEGAAAPEETSLGALDLCALSTTSAAVDSLEWPGWKRMEVTLDTGAGVSALPSHLASSVGKMVPSKVGEDKHYKTASGDVVRDIGASTVIGQTCDGQTWK